MLTRAILICTHFWQLRYYGDDDLVDDIPNTAAEIISGFATENAYYIGNEKLGSVSNVIYRARMCLETANGKQVCQDLNSNT